MVEKKVNKKKTFDESDKKKKSSGPALKKEVHKKDILPKDGPKNDLLLNEVIGDEKLDSVDKKEKRLKLKTQRTIAMDFAVKVYQKFDKMIKSIILFGSSAKHTNVPGSDIDIIIIIDDATIKFDNALIMWYREELGKIVKESEYKEDLHINTVKLTTWWQDLIRGDPVVINVLRYGETLIDFGGFFNPLKMLMQQGKIKPTPEAVYNCLNRVTDHIVRSKQSEIAAIEGCYWAMVDSAQALLMSAKVIPPSPEHIALQLKEHFVDKGLLRIEFVVDYRNIHDLHKRMMHGEISDIEGRVIDAWQDKSEEFYNVVMELIKRTI